MVSVLIVEDDRNLASAMSQILVSNDFNPEIAYDGITGLKMALNGTYDIIILDIMLPGLNGLEVCKRLKASGNVAPIIMVTARTSIDDRVVGLEAGADDYLPKPFSPKELIARMHALIRRSDSSGVLSAIRYGNLEYDESAGELSCYDDSIALSDKESSIISVLIRKQGGVCGKDELALSSGGDSSDGDNNIEAYISFLRKKIALIGANVKIATVRGKGYRLEQVDSASLS